MRRARRPRLDAPELPAGARPRWPAWQAPAALLAGIGVLLLAAFPLVPLLAVSELSDGLAAVSLLVLIVVQDGIFVGTAALFASARRPAPAWHFGVRPTRLWPTLGWTALGFALMLGFELGYIELLDVGETNVDDLGESNAVAGVAVALAAIVVAPVAEEIFFRAFFYRALRNRLGVAAAAAVDGLVFGALHFESADTAIILPVIAAFGVGQCLVYERTGSLFAVIAIHAAFNTVAMLAVAPLAAAPIGALVLLACLLVPGRLGRRPSPLPT